MDTKNIELVNDTKNTEDESNKFVNEVEKLVEQMSHVNIKSADELIQLILPLIKLASSYTKLSGQDKKNIVISAIKMMINKSNLSDELKKSLIIATDTIVPSLIDKIYIEEFKKCMSSLCCC